MTQSRKMEKLITMRTILKSIEESESIFFTSLEKFRIDSAPEGSGAGRIMHLKVSNRKFNISEKSILSYNLKTPDSRLKTKESKNNLIL